MKGLSFCYTALCIIINKLLWNLELARQEGQSQQLPATSQSSFLAICSPSYSISFDKKLLKWNQEDSLFRSLADGSLRQQTAFKEAHWFISSLLRPHRLCCILMPPLLLLDYGCLSSFLLLSSLFLSEQQMTESLTTPQNLISINNYH